jgi:hypothetical protein
MQRVLQDIASRNVANSARRTLERKYRPQSPAFHSAISMTFTKFDSLRATHTGLGNAMAGYREFRYRRGFKGPYRSLVHAGAPPPEISLNFTIPRVFSCAIDPVGRTM